jgi:hypothetical protein
MGEKELPNEELGPVLRLHDPAGEGAILKVDIRPDRAEGHPLSFDERAVVGRRGEDRIVAALGEPAGYAEIGVNVPERAEAGD